MRMLKKIIILLKCLYRKVMGLPVFIVIVQEEYQVDKNGNEIPGTRVKNFCVKNDVSNEIIQCFNNVKDAQDLCDEYNNPKPTDSKKKFGI